MAESEYQRLTWSRRRQAVAVFTVARASLWLGKDHLLCIETNGYTESYKRFYFRDVQAILIRKTNARLVATIILAILGALLLLIGLISGDRDLIIIFGTLAGLLCVIPLIINFALGQTCACQIRTAVQTEDLPIGRLGKAHKVMDRIRPLIAEAQGQLNPSEIPAQMQALYAAANAPRPAAAPASPAAERYIVDDANLPPRIIS
jgi:hypothetical protein